MGLIGVPELILIGIPLLGLAAAYVVLSRHRARRFGYQSTWAYLAATPRSDEEKRDAADMALKGLMFCMLGLVFPPLVFVGLVPLFYGSRKLAHALMGLDVTLDGDEPGI